MANTVTIDERDGEVILHVKYGESICGDCHTRQLVDSLNKELDAWRKKASALEDERDDLMKNVKQLKETCEIANRSYEAAWKERDSFMKERDELKAKMESTGGKIDFNVAQETVDHLRNRLAAAERLINFILNTTCSAEIREMIFAYREKKGGVK